MIHPGTEYVVHLNNAGAALMPQPVAQVVQDYLDQELIYGGYETAAKHNSVIESVYRLISRYLGCDASEIGFDGKRHRSLGTSFSILFPSPQEMLF